MNSTHTLFLNNFTYTFAKIDSLPAIKVDTFIRGPSGARLLGGSKK